MEHKGAQGHLRAWEPQASEAAGARLGGVWRAVEWERQGLQDLGWVLGLKLGIEERVRFTMAKFGCDLKEAHSQRERPESLES